MNIVIQTYVNLPKMKFIILRVRYSNKTNIRQNVKNKTVFFRTVFKAPVQLSY